MLGRYLGTALMTLLIGLWLASGVYGFLRLRATKDQAAKLQVGTTVVRADLEAVDPEGAVASGFPEGEIARAIQFSWTAEMPIRPFPRGLSTPPPR